MLKERKVISIVAKRITGKFYSNVELCCQTILRNRCSDVGLLTMFEIRIEYISLEENSSSFNNMTILTQIFLVNITVIRN